MLPTVSRAQPSAKEGLARGWSSWHEHLSALACGLIAGMTGHPLGDTFITAQDLAKGPKAGELKDNPGKRVFKQIHFEVQGSSLVISVKDRSKYFPSPLQKGSTQEEKADKGNY